MDYKEIFTILEEDIFSGFRATKQGTRYIESWLKEKQGSLFLIFDKSLIITIASQHYCQKSINKNNLLKQDKISINTRFLFHFTI